MTRLRSGGRVQARRAVFAAAAMALVALAGLAWPPCALAQEADAAPEPGVAPVAGAAPPIEVSASIDPRTGTIGDQLRLTLRLKRPSDVGVGFPNVEDEIAPLEVVDSVILPTAERGDVVTETREYLVAAFETGGLRVPGLGFYYETADGDTGSVWTDTLYLVIESVLPETSAVEELEPRDIKPPIELPRTIWPYILVAALAVAAFVAYRYLMKWWRSRRKPEVEAEPEEPRIPRRAAHVLAFERLKELERDDPIGRGEIPEFYVAVTDVLRLYLMDRFGVDAIDMTTAELGPAMKDAAIEPEEVGWTLGYLAHADLAKFAKHVPESEEARGDFAAAWEFVERTRFRGPAPGEEPGEAGAPGDAGEEPGEDEAPAGGGDPAAPSTEDETSGPSA
jgi:hypothetical protein